MSKAHRKAKERKAHPKPSALATTAKVAGNLVAVTAGLPLGVNPVALLTAALGPTVTHLIEQRLSRYSQEQVEHVVESTKQELNVDGAGLAEAVQSVGKVIVPLTFEVLQAALTTTDRKKLNALGRTWAHGIHDQSKLFEEVLMVRALMQLEEPHLEILGGLLPGSPRPAAGDATIQRLNRDYEMVLEMTLQTLQQLGLIARDPEEAPVRLQRWKLTKWGLRAAERLDLAAAAAVVDERRVEADASDQSNVVVEG